MPRKAMTDFSNLTSRFRAHKSTSQPVIEKVIKRPQLACKQCQKSKLRCDRGKPCSNCARKGEGTGCVYNIDASQKPAVSRSNVAEDRLLHLESMVRQLMETQTDMTAPGIRTVPQLFTSPDQPLNSLTTIHNARNGESPQMETGYVGSTHWSAILDDIQDLRSVLADTTTYEQNQTVFLSGSQGIGEEIIYGSHGLYSLSHIIAHVLPAKVVVDRYLAAYFQGEAFISPFLHTYHFQRQYAEFWNDTSKANPLWLSILLSICSMSSQAEALFGPPGLPKDRQGGPAEFHEAAGQCLVLGKYHRPQPHVLEAITLYGHYNSFRTLDPSREVGTLLGIAIRLAYEMGLHRDPDYFGSFTPFEGEMRRRLWSSCKQLDLMVSFQLGLPSSICLEDCDTKSPRNLLDSDFDEHTEVLPDSRPDTEPNRLLWFIVKERQMLGFSKVCQAALSCREKSPEEIAQLDNEIRAMHTTIPAVFRARPLSESMADAPFLIMTRVFVEFIYLKSLCVLHRKYVSRGSQFSMRCCTEAGMLLVSKFIDVYKEFTPGGQLYSVRWMLRTFTMADFLLGVMVLCLVVHTDRKSNPLDLEINAATKKEIFVLLEHSYDICMEKSEECRDARRAASAISIILRDPERTSSQTNAPSQNHLSQANFSGEQSITGEGWDLGDEDMFSYPWQSYLLDGYDAFGQPDHLLLSGSEN